MLNVIVFVFALTEFKSFSNKVHTSLLLTIYSSNSGNCGNFVGVRRAIQSAHSMVAQAKHGSSKE